MSALNFGRMLGRTRLFANEPAVTDLASGQHLTYDDLLSRVAAIVAALRNIGVASTDRVAILAGPSHRYIELWHAGLAGGFVICPLNSRFTFAELTAVVEDADCTLILHDAAHNELAREVAATVPSVKQALAFDGPDTSTGSLEALIRDALGAALPPEPDESAPAALIYTGGTTGRPKGVLHSQKSVATHILRMQITSGGELGHAFLSIMPLFHTGGMAGVGWFLPSGGHTYILPAFKPDDVLHTIAEHKITAIAGAPTMFAMLLEHPEFKPELLASLRLVYYGSSPMMPELLARLLKINPAIKFFQTYGMTETCGGITALRPEFHSAENTDRLASVGQPYLDVNLEIRDPQDGHVLETGEVGEIWVRSGSNLIEYWRQPELTAASVDNGWYRTGDAGRLDEEGFLYLADRVKDMIVTGGENVYSIEVERALASFPDVQQVAVIGVPDSIWGERVHAFVVGPTDQLNEDTLRDHLKEQIASYKIPKSWTIRTEPLPLSAAGKILKTELRELIIQPRPAPTP